MTTVLAVDLGGTKTALACVSDQGTLSDHVKLPAARSVSASVDQIVVASRAHEAIAAVGIIVPGIYSPETGRAWCPNLWGTNEVPLLDMLRDRLNVNVTIESDRCGYVLGEAWRGAARGSRHVRSSRLGPASAWAF